MSESIEEGLSQITKGLGIAHKESKKWDKTKSEYRTKFFDAIKGQEKTLAEKIVSVKASGLAEAITEAEKLYPAWTPLSANENGDNFDVRIKENAEYIPFTYVNQDDGMLYQKQVVAGAVMFDDERFKKDHPMLYHVVTYVPEPKRELKPLEDLSDEQIALVQDYVYEGKPVIKLAAPRKAKPEELE